MNREENVTAVFELFDSTLAEMAPELLGLWTTQSSSSDVAFALNSHLAADMPLWRSNFPADLSQADRLLKDREARLEESQAALDILPDRINRVITLAHSSTDGFAFSLPSTELLLTKSEQELLIALQALQNIGEAQSFDVTFGGDREQFGRWSQSSVQFQSYAKRAIDVLANYAWVETQIQGKTFARTAVGWTGDVNSIWMNGVNTEQTRLHQRTLALALASRDALFRSFTMAIQTALKISVLSSLPGGVILAVPSVWKLTNQIISQFRGDKDYGS